MLWVRKEMAQIKPKDMKTSKWVVLVDAFVSTCNFDSTSFAPEILQKLPQAPNPKPEPVEPGSWIMALKTMRREGLFALLKKKIPNDPLTHVSWCFLFHNFHIFHFPTLWGLSGQSDVGRVKGEGVTCQATREFLGTRKTALQPWDNWKSVAPSRHHSCGSTHACQYEDSELQQQRCKTPHCVAKSQTKACKSHPVNSWTKAKWSKGNYKIEQMKWKWTRRFAIKSHSTAGKSPQMNEALSDNFISSLRAW